MKNCVCSIPSQGRKGPPTCKAPSNRTEATITSSGLGSKALTSAGRREAKPPPRVSLHGRRSPSASHHLFPLTRRVCPTTHTHSQSVSRVSWRVVNPLTDNGSVSFPLPPSPESSKEKFTLLLPSNAVKLTSHPICRTLPPAFHGEQDTQKSPRDEREVPPRVRASTAEGWETLNGSFVCST